jgi:hypothetical protein
VLTDAGEGGVPRKSRSACWRRPTIALGLAQGVQVGGRLALGLPVGGMSPKLTRLFESVKAE